MDIEEVREEFVNDLVDSFQEELNEGSHGELKMPDKERMNSVANNLLDDPSISRRTLDGIREFGPREFGRLSAIDLYKLVIETGGL